MTQQMYPCPNCDYPVAFGSQFCINCGTRLSWQQQMQPGSFRAPPPQPERVPEQEAFAIPKAKSSPAVMTIVLIVFFLLVGAIAALVTLSPMPVISEVNASSVTGSTAVITWITNIASNSQCEYGTTTNYGTSSVTDETPAAAHSITLTGLDPATMYHCRVKSRSFNWNEAVSSDITFTTPAQAKP
jgi:hypothetical protein